MPSELIVFHTDSIRWFVRDHGPLLDALTTDERTNPQLVLNSGQIVFSGIVRHLLGMSIDQISCTCESVLVSDEHFGLVSYTHH